MRFAFYRNLGEDDQGYHNFEDGKDDLEEGDNDVEDETMTIKMQRLVGLTSSSRLHCLAQLVKISIGRNLSSQASLLSIVTFISEILIHCIDFIPEIIKISKA